MLNEKVLSAVIVIKSVMCLEQVLTILFCNITRDMSRHINIPKCD